MLLCNTRLYNERFKIKKQKVVQTVRKSAAMLPKWVPTGKQQAINQDGAGPQTYESVVFDKPVN